MNKDSKSSTENYSLSLEEQAAFLSMVMVLRDQVPSTSKQTQKEDTRRERPSESFCIEIPDVGADCAEDPVFLSSNKFVNDNEPAGHSNTRTSLFLQKFNFYLNFAFFPIEAFFSMFCCLAMALILTFTPQVYYTTQDGRTAALATFNSFYVLAPIFCLLAGVSMHAIAIFPGVYWMSRTICFFRRISGCCSRVLAAFMLLLLGTFLFGSICLYTAGYTYFVVFWAVCKICSVILYLLAIFCAQPRIPPRISLFGIHESRLTKVCFALYCVYSIILAAMSAAMIFLTIDRDEAIVLLVKSRGSEFLY
ncbi:hypothetical protein NEAUS06_2300 [Nematocida ausubeli]|nr:hypothetical protein NEAUS06_2300 [Nematocida ausubeli]